MATVDVSRDSECLMRLTSTAKLRKNRTANKLGTAGEDKQNVNTPAPYPRVSRILVLCTEALQSMVP